MLTIENLCASFGNKKVLDNVSLSVPHGSVAVLLGPSGVGKSTLLRVLNALEEASTGSVTLDGKPVSLEKGNKSKQVGMVFQQFNLFDHLTVEQNITLPLEKVLDFAPEKAKTIAHELLEEYQLSEKAHKRVSELSGGQKQRLAIARTIALKPRVVCLDEPTSALDPLLTSHVAQNIRALAKQGFIVLVATHDTALLERLPCTIHLMQDGKLVESALSDQFAQHKEQYPQIARFVAGTIAP